MSRPRNRYLEQVRAVFDPTRLSEREKMVAQMRYFENKTYDEIGIEFDVTRERVRQIDFKILKKLGVERVRQ